MERRNRVPPGWDGVVKCRICEEPVHLSRRRMAKTLEGRVVMDCPSCGHIFPVRVSDPFIPQSEPQLHQMPHPAKGGQLR